MTPDTYPEPPHTPSTTEVVKTLLAGQVIPLFAGIRNGAYLGVMLYIVATILGVLENPETLAMIVAALRTLEGALLQAKVSLRDDV